MSYYPTPFLSSVFCCVMFLVIWFKTSLPNKFFWLLFRKSAWWKDYEEYKKKSTVASNVREYWWQKTNHWLFELLNCHYCLGFWLVLNVHLMYSSPIYFVPFTYIVVMILYKLT